LELRNSLIFRLSYFNSKEHAERKLGVMAVIVGCKQPLLMGFVIVDGCGMVIDYEIVIILVIVIDYGYYYYLIMVIIPGYYCWWISSNGCEVING